jgi:hypothetical protein
VLDAVFDLGEEAIEAGRLHPPQGVLDMSRNRQHVLDDPCGVHDLYLLARETRHGAPVYASWPL